MKPGRQGPRCAAAGLGDARVAEVLARLEAEAAELAGEPVLGQLVETASEELTRLNAPGEPCAFCLEPQEPEEPSGGGGDAAGPPRLLRLPCYHCFHLCAPACPPGCLALTPQGLRASQCRAGTQFDCGDSASARRACAGGPRAGRSSVRLTRRLPGRAARASRASGGGRSAPRPRSARASPPSSARRRPRPRRSPRPAACPTRPAASPCAARPAGWRSRRPRSARLGQPAAGKSSPAGLANPGQGAAAQAGDERGAAAAVAAGERGAGERGDAGSAERAGGAPAAEDRAVRLAVADLARLRLAQQANAERFRRQQAAVRAPPPCARAHCSVPRLADRAGRQSALQSPDCHQTTGVRMRVRGLGHQPRSKTACNGHHCWRARLRTPCRAARRAAS